MKYQRRPIYKRTAFFLVLCFSIFLNLPGQEYQGLYTLLPTKAHKDLDKVFLDLDKANVLIQEANDHYQMALSLQSDTQLEEQDRVKRIAGHEKDAVKLHIKADKLYAKANEQLFKICFEQIEENSATAMNEDVTSAQTLMNDAQVKRGDAGSTNNPYQKAALLNEAAEMERNAIENLILVMQGKSVQALPPVTDLSEYSDLAQESPASTYSVSNVSPSNQNVVLNNEQIAMYEAYVSDPSRPDPFIYDPRYVTSDDSLRMEVIREFFSAYNQYGNDETITAAEAATEVTQEVDISDYAETSPEELTMAATIYSQETATDISVSTKSEETAATVPVAPTYEPVKQIFAPGVRFMVQIAASRAPLTRTHLNAILSGNHTVEVVYEDNWYKYRVTGFRLFSEANEFARKSGVDDAWVLSTNEGSYIPLPGAREKTRSLEAEVKVNGLNSIPGFVDYYVQVAAARLPLGDDLRKNLCPDNACRMIIEEGWFKYQLYAGTSFQDAAKLIEDLNQKAFIVAYSNGRKIVP